MIYLDNAATTFPKPLCVSEEISKCIKKYCGNPGRSSHNLSIKSAEKIYETRSLLAELFNANPENVVFTYNTTYALNIAIKSMIKYSGHVLISDIEHNSVIRPIQELANQRLCTYETFSTNGSNEEIIKDINNKIKSNTFLLVCTHISNVGSRRLPIKEIGALCKTNEISFIVDGAQSAGILDIDVKNMNIDALCIPSHKGLYGPQGSGAVIFNTDKIYRNVIEGGTGINSLELNMPDFLPEKFEAGTMSTPVIAAWGEALKWLKAIEVSKIRRYEEDLYDLCKSLLKTNKNITLYEMNEYSGNTLMFNVNNCSPSKVASCLNDRDIAVRSGFHCSPLAHKQLNTGKNGAVRVSFSVFNTRNEINQFYEAINEITKGNP
ncbi:MAG: aminotransferase class V-fold PLP-dependent enzyme [Clostridia bacterium]|nr:aminotransferase class V-fold PLP-dependent enzyme [Clostridia bacterium]